MPDIAENEWQLWMAGGKSGTNAPGAAPASLLPLSQEELAKQQQVSRTAELTRQRTVENLPGAPEDLATRMGARPGIPFDTTSGLPGFTGFLNRATGAFQPTPEERLKALERDYPGAVRTNRFGMPIVTIKDKEGKSKDVLADPIGIDWEDTTKLMEEIPAMGAVIGSLILTRGRTMAPGILNALKTLLLTTGAYETEKAGQDVITRTLSGEPIQPREIAERRGSEGAMNLALGVGTGVGGKILATAASPFTKFGPIQQSARRGQELILQRHGINLGLTPAELTGSPILQRTEAMATAYPGSSTKFTELIEKRWQQFQELQDTILGGEAPQPEAAGRHILETAQARLAPAEFEVQRTASQAGEAAQREIEGAIGPRISKPQAGAALRTSAEAARTASEAERERLYGIVESNPLVQNKNIPMDDIAADAGARLARLPHTERTVQRQTGLFGPSGGPMGSPITVTTTVRTPVREFYESGVAPKLRALSQMADQPMRLDELMRMRSKVRQEIAVGEAVPGWKSGDLGNIRDMLTDKIRRGLGELDPRLLRDWEKANAFYAQEAQKFERAGIAEFFRDPRQPNYLTDEELVTRLSEGKKASGVYAAYRDFFGAASPEMGVVRKTIRDDVLKRGELSTSVDAKGFVQRLMQMDQDAPEMLADVFGPRARELKASALAKLAAEGGTLDKNELAEVAASGNMSAERLSQMMAAQAKRNDLYRNELFRDIAKGTVDYDRIRPTEVVNKIVFDKRTQPDSLLQLTAMINDRPDLLQDIRRLTFKEALDRSTVTGASGTRILDTKRLDEMLADRDLTKKLRATLGLSTFEDLVAIRDFFRVGAIQQQSAKSAGGIGAGQHITALLERGDLSYVDRAIKNFLLATIYTSKPMRAYAANSVLYPQDKAYLVNGLIASAPMIDAIRRTYTDEGQKAVAVGLSALRQDPTSKARVTGQLSEEDWNKWMGLKP